MCLIGRECLPSDGFTTSSLAGSESTGFAASSDFSGAPAALDSSTGTACAVSVFAVSTSAAGAAGAAIGALSSLSDMATVGRRRRNIAARRETKAWSDGDRREWTRQSRRGWKTRQELMNNDLQRGGGGWVKERNRAVTATLSMAFVFFGERQELCKSYGLSARRDPKTTGMGFASIWSQADCEVCRIGLGVYDDDESGTVED